MSDYLAHELIKAIAEIRKELARIREALEGRKDDGR